MTIKELKIKSARELNLFLKEEEEHLCQLRFDLASKKLKRVREVREVKKTIARILTLLKQSNEVKPLANQPSEEKLIQ